MSLNLHINDVEDIVLEKGKLNYLLDNAGTGDIKLNYDYQSVKGAYKELILDDFRITYGQSEFFKKTTLFFEFEAETVEMHFTLNGNSTMKIAKQSNSFSYATNMHNIFYGNNIKGQLDWHSDKMTTLEINLRPSFFMKYLPMEKGFQEFRDIIEKNRSGFLNNHSYPITAKMHLVINEIIHCPWKNSQRKLFLEAKVLELLFLQIEQISSFQEICLPSVKSAIVLDKIHHAKEVILANIDLPLKLEDLAKKVETNECTLKKGFKEVFGTTVFGFIKEIKMEEAKNMLLSGKLSVKEVADHIGYKNPQHFSTAFKRKFGLSPTIFSKSR